MSQGSHDPDDETLSEADQEELRDTLSGLAPTAQDPDEDEAYTPTQDEERSWQTFEHYTGSHLRQTHSHRCRGSVYHRTLLIFCNWRLGRAGPHDLVLALAHLYVSKSPTGCLRPSARPEGSFANLTKRV